MKTLKIIIFSVLVLIVGIIAFNFMRTDLPPGPTYDASKNLTPGFPEIPVYRNAKLKESRREHGAVKNIKGYSAMWEVETNEKAPEIADWYKKEMERLGWIFEEPDPMNYLPTEVILIARKGDTNAMVLIENEDSDTAEILIDIPLSKL